MLDLTRLERLQDQGTANALLSNVSISIDWAAACVAGDDGGAATGAGADISSVVVKIGDFDLKFAGAPPSSSPPTSRTQLCQFINDLLYCISA
jgi:hypothetical protein